MPVINTSKSRARDAQTKASASLYDLRKNSAMCSIFILAVFAAFIFVSPTEHPGNFAPSSHTTSLPISKRQTSSSLSFPPACSDQCASLQNSINTCQQDNCFCTPSVFMNLGTCFQCISDTSGLAQSTQQILNQVGENCTRAGFAIPPVNITAGVTQSQSILHTGSAATDSGSSTSSTTTESTLSSDLRSSKLSVNTGLLVVLWIASSFVL